MKTQWRNLGAILVIVVIVAGIYILTSGIPITLTGKTAFEQNFDTMVLIWAEQGIPVKGMDTTVHEWVYDLDSGDLDSVKAGLIQLRAENAGKDAATEALIDVYISHIAWVKKDKEVVVLTMQTDNMTVDTACDYVPTLRQRNALMLESIELGTQYSEKAEAFDTGYADAATIAGVYIPVVDTAWLQESTATRDAALLDIEAGCVGGVVA